MASTEIANAYISLQVKMPGVKGDIEKSLGGSGVRSVAEKSGVSIGDNLLSGIGKTLKVGAVAVGGILAAGIGTALLKGFQRLNAIDTARAKLTGLGNDAKTVDTVMVNALTSVKGTAFGLGDAATVAAQAVAAGIKPGEDLERVLGTVANTAAAAGTGLDEMGSIFAKAMTQVNGVQNDVIGQLADRGIPIYKELGKILGVTGGEVFKLASQGKIDFETFAAAATAASGTVAAEMGGTWSGVFDNFMASLGRVGEGLLVGLFPQLKEGLKDVTSWLAPFEKGAKDVGAAVGAFLADAGPKLIDALKGIWEGGTNVVQWLKDNSAWLIPVAVGFASVAAAAIATQIGMKAYAAIMGVVKTAQVIYTAATYGLVGATYAFEAGTLKSIIANGLYRASVVASSIATGVKTAALWVAATATNAWAAATKLGTLALWLMRPAHLAAAAALVGEKVALVASTVAKNAATIAQKAFNAVMSANPIMLVVAAVAALVAGLTWFFTQTEVGKVAWQSFMDFMGTVWTAITGFFQSAYDTVIVPVFDGIKSAIDAVGGAFEWFKSDVVDPVWGGIKSTMSTVWTWINTNVFTPFKNGIDLIAKGFETAKKAIEKTWNGIKEAAAKPINFVLGTIWNDGLLAFWNDLVNNLGLPGMKLDKAPLIKFAQGGVMPGYTPGRDVHQFWSPTAGGLALSGGEAIMRPEFTRAVGGPAGVDALNRQSRNGTLAFKDGGVFGGVGDFFSGLWDTVVTGVSVAADFISDPFAAIQKYVIDGVIKPLMGDGAGAIAEMVVQLPINLVNAVASRFFGGTVGEAGMGWEAMWDAIQAGVPGAQMTSNFREGSKTVNGGTSYHASGRAVDIIPASMDTFTALKQLFPNASELIYTPAGGEQLQNGKSFSGWSEAVADQHWDHVHLAMAQGGVVPKLYDEGGWLPHGGVGVNLTGRPEAVLTPDESQALKSGLRAGQELRLVVEGYEFSAYVDDRADGRVRAHAPSRAALRSVLV